MSAQNITNEVFADLVTGFEKLPDDLLYKISGYGEDSFITELVASCPDVYVQYFLVAHREIWELFTVNDWRRILIRLHDNEIGLYTIISFLSKYQIVDSLEIYKSIPGVNEQVRSNVLEYFSERPGLLRLHRFELKYLLANNVTWVDIEPAEDNVIKIDGSLLLKEKPMNDEWRFTTKSVTKYNPVYRDENGHYKKNEWISFYQIGESIEGEELSLGSYLLIEERYVEAAMAFFRYHKCDKVIVRNLEKYNWDGYNLADKDELLLYYAKVIEGAVIPVEDIRILVRLVLRELLWAEFFSEQSEDVVLRFGYDFYMYFNANQNMDPLFEKIKKLGLFVD